MGQGLLCLKTLKTAPKTQQNKHTHKKPHHSVQIRTILWIAQRLRKVPLARSEHCKNMYTFLKAA